MDYYNDAAKAIVLMRPDAHTKNVQFNCAAGTKQSLPADALRLIEVQTEVVQRQAWPSLASLGLPADQQTAYTQLAQALHTARG